MAREVHVDALVQARNEDYPGLFEQCPAALWEQDYACVQQMLTAMTRDTPDLRQYFRSHPERFIECLRAVRITQVNAAALTLHGVTSRAALFRSFTDYLEPAVYYWLHEELLLLSQGETAFAWQRITPPLLNGPRRLMDLQWRARPESRQTLRRIIVALTPYHPADLLVGDSPAMHALTQKIATVALFDVNVLITGETGSGKELVAHAIHRLSGRQGHPFVPVNCSAIPDTLFESQMFGYRKGAFTGASTDLPGYFDRAQGGTLFLDEIGDLPLAMQAKLLRVVEDQTYTPVGATASRFADVRIVTATNKALRAGVRQGTFRADLFYRLNAFEIAVPPLRAHKEDIPALTDHFLQQFGSPPGRLAAYYDQFAQSAWPGNVRELKHTIGQMLFGAPTPFRPESGVSVPDSVFSPDTCLLLPRQSGLIQQMQAYERRLVCRALQQAGGRREVAARLLQIPPRTFYRKLKQFDLAARLPTGLPLSDDGSPDPPVVIRTPAP